MINHVQTSGTIHYDDINFLPYPSNNNSPKTEFFNLFLGFKAKPAPQINYNLVNLILWHIEHILSNSDKKFAEYFIWWIWFLIFHSAVISEAVLVLRSLYDVERIFLQTLFEKAYLVQNLFTQLLILKKFLKNSTALFKDTSL